MNILAAFRKQYFTLTLLCVLMCKLFAFRGIEWTGLMEFVFYGLIGAVLAFYTFKSYKNGSKSAYHRILWIYVFMLIACFFTGSFIGGQSFYYTFRGILIGFGYTGILIFFMLDIHKISIEKVESSIIILFLLYCLVYAIDFISLPDYIFGTRDEFSAGKLVSDAEKRGVYRFAIPYEDIITLILFYVISKTDGKRIGWLLFLVALTFMRGTRTPIAVSILFAVILYFSNKSGRIFTIIVGGCIAAISAYLLITYTGIGDIVGNMFDVTKDEQENFEENVRYGMTYYYLFEYNHSFWEVLFGHGIPVNGSFQQDLAKMSDAYSFWTVDVGFVDYYVMFGLCGIALLIAMLIIAIRTKVPYEYQYAKYFVIYIILCMSTNESFVRATPLIAICFYVLYTQRIKKINI